MDGRKRKLDETDFDFEIPFWVQHFLVFVVRRIALHLVNWIDKAIER